MNIIMIIKLVWDLLRSFPAILKVIREISGALKGITKKKARPARRLRMRDLKD